LVLLAILSSLACLIILTIIYLFFTHSVSFVIKIIDEYLYAVRSRLKRNRRDLKFLKKDFASKQSDIKTLSKKLEDLHQERLSQIVTEAEIDQEIEEEAETQHVEEITHVIDLEDREVYLKAKYDNKQQVNEDSYVTTENLFDLLNVPKTLAEIKFILDQSVKHYRAGVVNDEKVKLIIEALNGQVSFIKGDFKEIVETYKKEIRKIRIGNNIGTLSSIERNLLLDHLKKISTRLESDHLANLSDDKTVEVFVLKMMEVIDKDEEQEHNIAKKLQIRFEGQYLLGHDRLKDDIDSLISLIEDRKTFYLEKCAINFTQESIHQTECEKAMLAYNKQPNLEDLVSVVSKFKMHQEQVLRTKIVEQFSKEYLQSVEGFILTVLENIRYHGMVVLNNIIENNNKQNKKSAGFQEKNLELIEVIINDIKTRPSSRSIALIQTIKKIIEIMKLFREAVKSLRSDAKSKKEANRSIKSLESVTKKLIKYINSDNKSSQEIGMIVGNYLLLLKSPIDIEGVEDISEQLKSTNERIISKTTKQEQNGEATADISSKKIVETSSNSNLKGINIWSTNIGWINSYFSEYTLNAIENILELRVNNLGLEEVTIARGHIFQENYNNLQKMFPYLANTKSGAILAPLNLYNKHAVGIMGVKDQDNGLKLYYIDPSNENIPDRLKQIFINNALQIEQLATEQQKYANCGPEVIENFMLYLTGKRLSQEESIAYHSQLLEQELVSKANNLVKVMDNYTNDQKLLDDLYCNDDQEGGQLESNDVNVKALSNTSCHTEYLVPISPMTDFTESFEEDKKLITNCNNTTCDNISKEQKAFAIYSQGNLLSNEAWEAESDEYNDRSVEAEQKFAKSLQLYKEAVKLSPTNIAYKHALDITSLKIEGNSSFSQGVVIASIAYELQEVANELAVYQEAYQEILGKYQQALEFYKTAQVSFHEGWCLSKDSRFKSCIEIVQDSIGLIQGRIEKMQAEVDNELIQKPNDITGTDDYLARDPIELFRQDDQVYVLNDYLIGNIAQEIYYM
jgi:hypothetical protein